MPSKESCKCTITKATRKFTIISAAARRILNPLTYIKPEKKLSIHRNHRACKRQWKAMLAKKVAKLYHPLNFCPTFLFRAQRRVIHLFRLRMNGRRLQYETHGALRRYVVSVSCLNIKSATSAREILALMALPAPGSPCRYAPVRSPFVNAPGRTIVHLV